MVVLAAVTQRWLSLLALLAIGAVGMAAMFAALVLARHGQHRVLLLSRTPTGRAGLVLHLRNAPDGPYWLLENMWARTRGPRPAERAQRPGAVLLHQAILLAGQHNMTVRLIAADQAVATKV